jgi:hypothetical protein
MPIANSQTVTGNAASAASITLASWTPAANDLILLVVLTRQTTVTHTSVAGNGLTWTKLVELNGSTNIRASLWWAQGAAPTLGQITVTLSGAPATALAVAVRFSGVDSLEASGSNSNASSAAPSVDVTPITADAWAVGAFCDRSSTFTVGGGETGIVSNVTTGTSGNTLKISIERIAVPAPAATTLDGTWSAAVSWAAAAAALKPAGTAPVGDQATKYLGGAVAISGG